LFIAGISTGSISFYNKGGQLDEIREPHLIEATHARAISTYHIKHVVATLVSAGENAVRTFC